jgi:folate-dependent phosphoribosylglycinamide formyltransferase PurN
MSVAAVPLSDTSRSPMRIAIVSNGNFFSTSMIRPLVEDPAIEVVGALVVSVPGGRGGTAARLVRLARRTGVRYTAFKAFSLLVPGVAGRARRAPVFLGELCRRHGVPFRAVRSVNGDEAFRQLKGAAPEVLVSVSCPERLTSETLGVAGLTSINVHWALLPAYGGIAPYFWVLRNGERQTGVTVHVMAETLDLGAILRSRPMPIEPGHSALSLQLRLARAGAEELHDAVRELPESLRSAVPQRKGGRSYYTWPSASDVRALRRRGGRLARLRDLRAIWREVGALRG